MGYVKNQQRTLKSDLIYKFLSFLSRFENIPVKESQVSSATEFNALCVAFYVFENYNLNGFAPILVTFQQPLRSQRTLEHSAKASEGSIATALFLMKAHKTPYKQVQKRKELAIRLASITSPDIMRWRSGRQFLISVASFTFGCILTLLLCSSNDSTLDLSSSEPNQAIKYEEEDWKQIREEPNEKMTTEEMYTTPPTTTFFPKPTLPPYPPVSNGKPIVLTPFKCNEDAFLIIVVISSSRNFEARKSIRSSWGKSISEVRRFDSNSSRESFQVFFVVGGDEENDERVEKEAEQYGDILRGNFMDIYVQNEQHTVKTLLGLKWATSICNPQYILKVNSDSFVNVHGTIKWLHSLGANSEADFNHIKKGLYAGYCHRGVRPVRNPLSAYFISEDQWSEFTLPQYVSGVGILLSRDVAEKMANHAREVIRKFKPLHCVII